MDGADGVMVSGCHPGDCHYLAGNLFARRRFTVLKKMLTTVGIEEGRVQFTWVSASEGNRFAEVVREVTENIVKLGPNPLLNKEARTEIFSDLSESLSDKSPENIRLLANKAKGKV